MAPIESRAHLIARHPAWRLNKNGVSVWHPLVVWLILPFWVTGILGMFLTTPAIVNPNGLLLWWTPIKYVSWGLGALTFWVLLGLGKQDDTGPYHFKPMILGLVAGVILGIITIVTAQLTALRTLPRLAMTISPSQIELQVETLNIHRIEACRKKCLIAPLTGSDKLRYGVKIDNYPNTIAPLVFPDPPPGFPISPTIRDGYPDPVRIEVSGVGNWAGLRVMEITRADR
jgi:hypothetical protein